jgi:hypothetical protein
LSPSVEDDKKSLLVAGDACWDKWGSGRKKDSLSGRSVFNGNMTKLTLGLEPMSKVCIKCAKGVEPDRSVCPKNYIEAAGSGRLMTNLFDTGKVVIGMHVGDDDSSCRMVMHHSFQDLIETGKIESVTWPQYKGKG